MYAQYRRTPIYSIEHRGVRRASFGIPRASSAVSGERALISYPSGAASLRCKLKLVLAGNLPSRVIYYDHWSQKLKENMRTSGRGCYFNLQSLHTGRLLVLILNSTGKTFTFMPGTRLSTSNCLLLIPVGTNEYLLTSTYYTSNRTWYVIIDVRKSLCVHHTPTSSASQQRLLVLLTNCIVRIYLGGLWNCPLRANASVKFSQRQKSRDVLYVITGSSSCVVLKFARGSWFFRGSRFRDFVSPQNNASIRMI